MRRRGKTLVFVEFPVIHDTLFLGWADQVCLIPMLQADCFCYIVANLGPTVVPILLGVSEDSFVSFLPELPKDKAWEQLPDVI
jgi:hypothetical protein